MKVVYLKNAVYFRTPFVKLFVDHRTRKRGFDSDLRKGKEEHMEQVDVDCLCLFS